MDTRSKTLFALGGALSLALCGAIFSASRGLEASAVDAPSLFLPGSYEEYLPLDSPSDAAMSEDYIAVADGYTLYLYDREQNTYTSYTHEYKLSEVQFTEDGRLFFNDSTAQLYLYRFTTDRAEVQSGVPCATFLIEGDTLFTASVAGSTTTIYAIPCDSATVSFSRAEEVGEPDSVSGASPLLAYSDDCLYCTFNYRVTVFTPEEDGYSRSWKFLAGETTDVSNVSAFTAHEGEFYYAVNGTLDRDGLYHTTLGENNERIFEGSGFSSLFSFDGTLYGVQNGSVRAFSLENGAASLTGYEIGGASDAPNRISDAGDAVRAGGLLVIADQGNDRVLLYDETEKKFSSVALGGEPGCVATDGESFAVSVGNSIRIYTYGESEPRYAHTAESSVSGITCVYGKYYYVTSHSYYGVAEEGAREFTRANGVPVALTSDLTGNIYVATAPSAGQIASVSRFTESEFLDYSSAGTIVTENWSLPAGAHSLRADYEGSLYYLSGSALYRNGVRLETFDASSSLYHGTEGAAPSPVSFALSFSDGTLYLNYGDFMLKTELSFPNLGAIPAQGMYETLHTAPAAASLSYVEISGGAVGIRVDLSALTETSPSLAYAAHGRIEGGTALVLGETGQFTLLALAEDNNAYTVLLVPTENCTPVPVKTVETESTRYLSSDVSLTSYPLFSDALAEEELPRGTAVTVIAEVTPAKGPAFAEVRLGENGHGYVPLSYLTQASPLPGEHDSYRLGYLKADENGITFRAVHDETLTVRVTERTQVKIYDADNGAFDVYFEDEAGTLYTTQVTEDMLEAGGEDALRTSMIVILCVIAVGIGGVYILLVPKKTKNG